MKKLLVAFALVTGMVLVNNSSAHAAAGWSSWGYISTIDQQNRFAPGGEAHGIWIIPDGTVYNDSCGSSTVAYFLPDDEYPSTPNSKFKQDLALVMSAYHNNRPIAFYISGCYNNSNPIIAIIRIG